MSVIQNREKRKYRRRSVLFILGCAGLTVTVIASSMAMITGTDKKENLFTVKGFYSPEVADPDHSGQQKTIEGYIYEEKWDENTDDHLIVPGQTTIKDPKVGIGKGSESAYVFVYIDNDYGDKVYFKPGNTWAIASGTAAKTGVPGAYWKGLFRYIYPLKGKSDGSSWTDPIFTQVITDSNAENLTAQKITVYCYLYQAKNGEETIPVQTAEEAAIAWMNSADGPCSNAD